MALSAAEQQELNQLEGDVGHIAPTSGGGGLSASEQAEMSQLEGEVGHVAPAKGDQPQAPQDDGGLIGEMYRGFHKLAVSSRNPVLNAMDLTNQGVAAISKYGGEAVRSRLLGDDNGQALTGDQYLASKGLPTGPSVELPTKALIGHDIQASPRAAAGAAIDLATDPATYLLAGEGKIAGALEKVPEAGQWVAKKGAKVFASIPEDTTARYLENPDAINNAPTSKDISNRAVAMKDASDKQVLDAHEELTNAKQSMADAKQDTRAGLQDQKFQAGNDLNEAQSNFNEKKQQFKEALKSNSLTSMATDVNQAVSDLRDKVTQGSNDSYDILGKSNGSVDVDPLIKDLQGHADSMKINGIPRNQSAAQSIDEIRAMQNRLFEMTQGTGGKLTMPQAKQMMQGLDKDLPYSGQPGSFAAPTEQAFKDLRNGIDSSVKLQSDPYKQKMLEVSNQTQLLKKANDLYGTPEKAISNLNNIDSEKGQALHVPLLQSLGKETGRDLYSSVNGYLLNQKVLSTPTLFDQAIENLPEAKSLQSAKGKMADISNPEYSRGVAEQATAPIQKRIDTASDALDVARSRQEDFKGITPDSITAKQKQLTGANSYGAEARWKNIDQKYGTNFENEIRARNDADAFSKDNTRGSRNAHIFGAIGGLAGELLSGHEAAIAGYGAGNVVGGVVDKYAGPMAKWSLDRGMNAGDAIRAVARGAKETTGPAQAAAILKFPEGSTAAAVIPKAASNNVPSKGPDKWASDGFQKLQSHTETDDDRELLKKAKSQLMQSPAGKKLLISASDLKPGSKAMQNLLDQVKSKFGGQQ